MATFWICRLRIIGNSVEAAEVSFGPHLNVVTGASDTGKSYILDCINYMFGAGTPPKDIPESKGYSTILLEFETSERNRHVLQRSLKKGGEFFIYDADLDNWTGKGGRVLKGKHAAGDVGTLSNHLLQLCGMDDVEISTSKAKKRPLSFRDIARFCLIKESLIIDEWSPMYPSRQFSKQPADKSVFDYLVSGEDASSMIASADPAVTKASWKAKFEIYDHLIDELKLEAPADSEKAEIRLKEIDGVVDSITNVISESNNAISAEQQRLNASWGDWHAVKSRQAVIGQLLQRFSLLEEHYRSDIERLSFLGEADHYLSQFGQEVYCPICGTLMDGHEKAQHERESGDAEIKFAARVEAAKLEKLLLDLRSTIRSLQSEQVALTIRIVEINTRIQESDALLKRDLEPRMLVVKKELDTVIQERRNLAASLEAEARLIALLEKQAGLGPAPKQSRTKKGEAEVSGDVGPRREFLDRVSELLLEWRHQPMGIVEFDEKMDLVVGGQKRASHGKGVRAIMHAAFTMALMIQARGRHPGLIVLDSPLTSYKEKDKYEADRHVQRRFFEYLMRYKSGQVIVLENKDPDADLAAKMYYEHFTGVKELGRSGFYPAL